MSEQNKGTLYRDKDAALQVRIEWEQERAREPQGYGLLWQEIATLCEAAVQFQLSPRHPHLPLSPERLRDALDRVTRVLPYDREIWKEEHRLVPTESYVNPDNGQWPTIRLRVLTQAERESNEPITV